MFPATATNFFNTFLPDKKLGTEFRAQQVY
jgi:hypothetical protein